MSACVRTVERTDTSEGAKRDRNVLNEVWPTRPLASVPWIEGPLDSVPSLDQARELARRTRARVGARPGAPVDLGAVCDSVRAHVRAAPLGAGAGGRQALLVPRNDGSFRIVVDDGRGDGSVDTARHRRRQRIAHELGHTMFYQACEGRRPRRSAPAGGDREEAFCDEFARALLVPVPQDEVTVELICGLQRTYDVSLEVAARAAATAPTRPSIYLWWWRENAPEIPVLTQWTNDPRLAGVLGITSYRTTLSTLRARFAERGFGPGCTAAVLDERRQALVVRTQKA